MLPPTPRSPLFPYTTLFRSLQLARPPPPWVAAYGQAFAVRAKSHAVDSALVRSEEHTSELQSRVELVCRLLLEKKKRRFSPWRHQTSMSNAAISDWSSCSNK